MGWEKGGRYYTRSRREGGRVVRQYVGSGKIGELAAQLDALERETRDAERARELARRDELAALDGPLAELDELADLLVEAAFVAAGYHRHHRGNWRKRRVHTHEADRQAD